jgi:seryl-tRNA synthetase
LIDIVLIREKPDWVKAQLEKLNDPAALERIDAVARLDGERRALLKESEALQALRNRLNRTVGALRGNKALADAAKTAAAREAAAAIGGGDYARAEAVLTAPDTAEAAHGEDTGAAFGALNSALGEMGARVEALTEQVRAVDAALDEQLLFIPNLPHESVPVAPDETHNRAWPTEGTVRTFDFTPRPHWELGPALGIIDFERGVRLTGSRGYVLMGMGARLQRALIGLFLDSARAHGFTELYVPYLVREPMMFGSGQFPKFRDVVYHDQEADLYLLPTAEVAVTNLHRDEILDADVLPLYYAAHTPCFRREKTSAGRDVRGIKRVHQFEKVELYKFTSPETSYAELESLTEAAADVCRALGLAFRRLEIVTGDLGFSATKKYDLEVYAPGCDEWLEVSSCSNTEAFQARRANIRTRAADAKKTQFVHTLNGSGLATPRVIIALLENGQQADGSVILPDVLAPYLGGETVLRPQ